MDHTITLHTPFEHDQTSTVFYTPHLFPPLRYCQRLINLRNIHSHGNPSVGIGLFKDYQDLINYIESCDQLVREGISDQTMSEFDEDYDELIEERDEPDPDTVNRFDENKDDMINDINLILEFCDKVKEKYNRFQFETRRLNQDRILPTDLLNVFLDFVAGAISNAQPVIDDFTEAKNDILDRYEEVQERYHGGRLHKPKKTFKRKYCKKCKLHYSNTSKKVHDKRH